MTRCVDIEVADRSPSWLTVGRVFGEPIERGGVTVIPVVRVSGGGGGGGGHDPAGQQGEGGGFGLGARPVGAYVVADGRVRWQPAIDVDRLIVCVAGLACVSLFTAGRRRRSSRRD